MTNAFCTARNGDHLQFYSETSARKGPNKRTEGNARSIPIRMSHCGFGTMALRWPMAGARWPKRPMGSRRHPGGDVSPQTLLEVEIRRRPFMSRASEVRMEKIKVLLFAANPRGTTPLDLPREFREIDEEVRLSTFRNAVELILVPGTRPVDLLRKLNENQPQVVHFSSHGSPDEILLESGRKTPRLRARTSRAYGRPTNET